MNNFSTGQLEWKFCRSSSGGVFERQKNERKSKRFLQQAEYKVHRFPELSKGSTVFYLGEVLSSILNRPGFRPYRVSDGISSLVRNRHQLMEPVPVVQDSTLNTSLSSVQDPTLAVGLSFAQDSTLSGIFDSVLWFFTAVCLLPISHLQFSHQWLNHSSVLELVNVLC